MYQFHDQKALFKVPKIYILNFWIENEPPPLSFALFRKFIKFGSLTLPLNDVVLSADFNLQFVVDIHVGIDPRVSFVFGTPLWDKEY